MPTGVNYSKFDRVDEFEDERKQYFKEEDAKIRAQERERKEREAAQGSKRAVVEHSGRTAICMVECDGVKLKLTLRQKFLERPLGTAVIEPFLKAFNKKRPDAPPVESTDLAGLVVDGDPSSDVALTLGVMAKQALLDRTRGQNDNGAFVETYHESWKPTAGICWLTEHEIKLLLSSSALGDSAAAAPAAAAPAPELS